MKISFSIVVDHLAVFSRYGKCAINLSTKFQMTPMSYNLSGFSIKLVSLKFMAQ